MTPSTSHPTSSMDPAEFRQYLARNYGWIFASKSPTNVQYQIGAWLAGRLASRLSLPRAGVIQRAMDDYHLTVASESERTLLLTRGQQGNLL